MIFALSAQPDLNSGLGTWDTILRKLAHMPEFGLLWFLWWRALGYGNRGRPRRDRDRLRDHGRAPPDHVDGRVGSPVDVLIDSAGVALAMLAMRVRARRRHSDSVAP